MTQKFSNNARSRLVGALSNSATSFTIESATADLFPIANTTDWLSTQDWFKATIQNTLGQVEIVHVGVRSLGSAIFANVQRGQDGTTAIAFDAGAVVGLRITAQDVEAALAIFEANNTFEGVNTFEEPIVGDLEGNAATVTNGVYTGANNTFEGVNTFEEPIVGDLEGNAATATALTDTLGVTGGGTGQITPAGIQSILPVQQTRVDVASASTVNLTSSVPSNDHINITGTTTITAFTVAAGRLLFVRFNAALTLTNNASIVTQRGANITTAAGDTCILRATAANTVEVISYTRAAPQALGDGQTWQSFTGSRSVNTDYTNNTGRAIAVAIIVGNNGTGSGCTLTVDSVEIGSFNFALTSGTFSIRLQLHALVPPGGVYRLTQTSPITLYAWTELRA